MPPAKTVLIIAAILSFIILVMVFGLRGVWDTLVAFATCIDANGACPWD